ALADAAARRAADPVLGGLPIGWRNVASQPTRKTFGTSSGPVEVAYRLTRDGLLAEDHPGVRLIEATPTRVVLESDGVRHRFAVAAYPGMVCVDSPLGAVSLAPVDRFGDPADQVAAGSLLAPMPAAVVAVHVAEGDRVSAGAALLVLEAMKMQQTINAAADGVVRSVNVQVGSQVDAGSVLAVVTPEES
ncbi:MAG: acetyl-CoA carboxylase biotin carboxyl carrier protein subunit, partial [Micromonosporaceae bacterium]